MKRLLLIQILLSVLLLSCTSARKSLQDEIVGKWTDSEGFTIEFFEDGTGFIPGVQGAIPDSNFTYQVIDETQVKIDFQGGAYQIEVLIKDDQLVWKDNLGEVVYTRAEN